MFVRAYDKINKVYYKSMVYGIFNFGYYEKAVLLNPVTKSFELVDYLDKEQGDLKPLYEVINSETEGWISREETSLIKFNHYCKEKGLDETIKLFRGYTDVFDDFDFMVQVLRDKKVSDTSAHIVIRENKDADEWNYISTQDDANQLMDLFFGFHDSTINKLVYEEDDRRKELTVTVDNSGWYGIIELCFEGLVAVNLRPPLENYSREIFGATLIVKDETVFWADGSMSEENFDYKGTYIKALNLKWRQIS